MVATVEELVELASQASTLRNALDAGDWYLVGSRATGHSDDLSDWDTILLVPGEPMAPDPDQASIDAVFKIVRPRWTGSACLEFDRSWRAVHGVDVEVIGRTAQAEREAKSLSEWAYTMAQASPLRLRTDFGERYRRGLHDEFERQRGQLQIDAYERFRRSRNESAAVLARADRRAQAIAPAICVAEAARFLLLASGGHTPPPSG